MNDQAAADIKALPASSDDALALRFSTKYGDNLLHVAAWGRWYYWTGSHWAQDTTLLTFDSARDICRWAARGANEGGKALASHKTVAAVVSMARADRRHAATIEQWDTDPWLLNTPTGTVNLRTGERRAPEPKDFITKITAVAPTEGGCPLWRAFLDKVLDEDGQLVEFVQRMLGYCLTGVTSEQALFFLYGLGSNGKGTLVNAVAGILGEHHRVAPMAMLLASKYERHDTEIAGLVGRRIVTATETEGGKRWAEAKLKALTGGDRVSARFMCRDYFDFTPQCKFVISGNHKPSLNSVDEAMRRRFNLIPFNVTIPEKERDPELGEKLKNEWPQILKWMIDGCLEWQEHGLDAPASVRDATRTYLAGQDTIKNWLEECTVEADAETPSATLFASWREWCDANGEFAGSSRTFSQRLTDLGLQSRHAMRGTVFRGRKMAQFGGA
jgi:putative DNA primase/helicase